MAKANVTTGRKTPKAAPPCPPEPEIFGPALTAKQVHELEEAATTEARGQQRRILLMVLSKGANDLAQISDECPDLYREMREMVHVFVQHARSMADFGQSAVTRLMAADIREDTSKEDAEAIALLKEGGAA